MRTLRAVPGSHQMLGTSLHFLLDGTLGRLYRYNAYRRKCCGTTFLSTGWTDCKKLSVMVVSNNSGTAGLLRTRNNTAVHDLAFRRWTVMLPDTGRFVFFALQAYGMSLADSVRTTLVHDIGSLCGSSQLQSQNTNDSAHTRKF